MLTNSRNFNLRSILPFALAILVALAMPTIINAIEWMGTGIFGLSIGIHDIDPVGDYLIGCLYAACLGFCIFFWPVNQDQKGVLMKLWFLRCCVTLGMMLVYEAFYQLDAYAYFFESRFVQVRWPVELADTYSIMSYIAWWINHNLLFHDSYHAQKVIFSFVGFLGSYLIYAGMKVHLRGENFKLMILMQVFPSIIFWSSILGKDPINYFATCIYSYGILTWQDPEKKRSKILAAICVLIGMGIAFVIRPWVAKILVPPTVLLFAMKVRSRVFRIVSVLAVIGVFVAYRGEIMQSFGVKDAEDLIKTTNAVSRSWSFGGSGQAVPTFAGFSDMLKFAPLGMFTALFRPLPGEVLNPFGMLAGLENATLLYFIFLGIRKRWKDWSKIGQGQKDLINWAITCILCWSFLYAFISYQNLGAAVRFKLQILPILLMLTVLLNIKLPKNDSQKET